MKKLMVIFLTFLQLFGMELAYPQMSEKVYLGKFLARGILPPQAVYSVQAWIDGEIVYLAEPYAKVKKGEVLAKLNSPTILELETRYIEALLQYRYYIREMKRIQPLVDQKIVARKELLKIQNSARLYRAKSKYFRELLKKYGVLNLSKLEKNLKPQSIIPLIAKRDGMVVDIEANMGDFIQKGSKILQYIDPNKVVMQIDLPLNVARAIDDQIFIGDEKEVVIARSHDVDTKTQSVRFLIKAKKTLLPGEVKEVSLYLPKKVLKLPKSAYVEGKVVVKRGDEFEVVEIDPVAVDDHWIYILPKKLNRTDQVVVKGAMLFLGGDDD